MPSGDNSVSSTLAGEADVAPTGNASLDFTNSESLSKQQPPFSHTMRRQRRAVCGLAIGFGVLVSVCIGAGVLAWQSSESSRAAVLTFGIRGTAYLAMQELLQAETSQRAFLLMHDDSFLQPYTNSVKAFREIEHRLDGMVDADHVFASDVASFRQNADLKLRELEQTVSLEQAGQTEQALALVRSGVGRRSMDLAAQAESRLLDLLDARLHVAAPRQALLYEILMVTIGLAALCVTGLSVWVFRDTRRNFRFLEAREKGLRKLAATLDDRVKRRTRALSEVNQRFEAALQAARVTVYTQDRNLRFTWISKSELGLAADEIVGQAEATLLPNDVGEPILRIKQRVLDTGEIGHGEVRLPHAGADRWYEMTVIPLRGEDGEVMGLIGGSVEITERKEQEARIRLLMRELTHRSKNLLAVIQAIMRQTAANSTSTEDFQQRFSERLFSLAGSHDLLVEDNWHGASLRDLIRSQLGHYTDLVGSQIDLSGEPLYIQPDAAQHIGMALHELATNAAKYGALSTPQGRVRIAWTAAPANDPEGVCTLAWEESNGPPVVPPQRRGFGRVVIERTVARALRGEVHVSYPPEGVHWQLDFPRSAVVSQGT